LCTTIILQGSTSPNEVALAVIDERDNETILLHRITMDEIYKQEGETILQPMLSPFVFIFFALFCSMASCMIHSLLSSRDVHRVARSRSGHHTLLELPRRRRVLRRMVCYSHGECSCCFVVSMHDVCSPARYAQLCTFQECDLPSAEETTA
jgi:hypothetical protein